MTITERIGSLLRMQGRTQRDICLALNLAPSTVSDWFRRRPDSIPSIYIVPLCKFFGISTDELLTGEVNGSMYLTQDERRLMEIYRPLPYDSQSLVMAAAVQEKRRMEEDEHGKP